MQGSYLSTLPISSGDSPFQGFLPITRSQQNLPTSRFSSKFFWFKHDAVFRKIIQFCLRIFVFSERERVRCDPCFDQSDYASTN